MRTSYITRHLLPLLSLTALLQSCDSTSHNTATHTPGAHGQYTSVMLDGYKGRVKEVLIRDNNYTYRNGDIDTTTPATGIATMALYDSAGWLLRKETLNIPDDGTITILGGKHPTPGGVNIIMRASRLAGRDSSFSYTTITGSWINDSTYRQTYWLGKDTTRKDGFYVTSIYDAQRHLVASTFPFMQEKDPQGNWPTATIRLIHNGDMVTSYETINGHTDTSVTRTIARDKHGNALKTTTVSRSSYTVSMFTYKYY